MTNSATVTPVTSDPVTPNNTASVTTTPSQSADLGVVKTLVDRTTPPAAGTDRSYLVTVTNYGTSDARDVVVVDTLPAGTTWTGTWSDHATWTCAQGASAREVRCTLTGTISGVGTPSVPLTLGVRIPADFDTSVPLLNTATVSASTPDPVSGNNSATDDSSAVGIADLGIAKTLSGPAAVAGSATAYTLQVTNDGPSVTRGLTTVTDVLPTGMTADPAHAPSGTGWACSVASLTITCTTSASLAVGAAAPITVPVLVDQATQGVVTNRATVAGTLPDPVPGNNAAELPTPIAELANVSVTKSTSTPTVVAGTSVTYTVTVTNAGPSTARGLTLNEQPPAGLTVQSVTGSGWTCEGSACTRAVLPVGTSTLTVVAGVDASVPHGIVLTNTVEIAVTTPHGPGVPEWTGSAPITVDTLAGVSVDKSHDPAGDPVLAGTAMTFTLVVGNAGPSDAVAPVTITDTLPAGMTFILAGGPWTCTSAGSQVDCVYTGNRIPAHSSLAPLTMVVGVDASVTEDSLTNPAVVTTGT